MPNGVICIVNGNALLVCSIWLCTGALMGAVNRFSPGFEQDHGALWWLGSERRGENKSHK